VLYGNTRETEVIHTMVGTVEMGEKRVVLLSLPFPCHCNAATQCGEKDKLPIALQLYRNAAESTTRSLPGGDGWGVENSLQLGDARGVENSCSVGGDGCRVENVLIAGRRWVGSRKLVHCWAAMDAELKFVDCRATMHGESKTRSLGGGANSHVAGGGAWRSRKLTSPAAQSKTGETCSRVGGERTAGALDGAGWGCSSQNPLKPAGGGGRLLKSNAKKSTPGR